MSDAKPDHVCGPGRSCICGLSDLEPNDNCPLHGGPPLNRCAYCGRFCSRYAALLAAEQEKK